MFGNHTKSTGFASIPGTGNGGDLKHWYWFSSVSNSSHKSREECGNCEPRQGSVQTGGSHVGEAGARHSLLSLRRLEQG